MFTKVGATSGRLNKFKGSFVCSPRGNFLFLRDGLTHVSVARAN